jgi:hypothetical protein
MKITRTLRKNYPIKSLIELIRLYYGYPTPEGMSLKLSIRNKGHPVEDLTELYLKLMMIHAQISHTQEPSSTTDASGLEITAEGDDNDIALLILKYL